jgi:hypothetical protein
VVDQATGEDVSDKVGPKPGRSDREHGDRGRRDQPEQAAD